MDESVLESRPRIIHGPLLAGHSSLLTVDNLQLQHYSLGEVMDFAQLDSE